MEVLSMTVAILSMFVDFRDLHIHDRIQEMVTVLARNLLHEREYSSDTMVRVEGPINHTPGDQ
jgi:hypothetical protein